MCGIKTTFMITQGCVAFSMDKKFLSLEKFYTNIVTGVSDYYEVWSSLGIITHKGHISQVGFNDTT